MRPPPIAPSTSRTAIPLRARLAASWTRFSVSISEMVRVSERPMPKSNIPKMPTRLSAMVNTPQRLGPRSRTRYGVAKTATSSGPARPTRFHMALFATVRELLSARIASWSFIAGFSGVSFIISSNAWVYLSGYSAG
jgi:hypothetical protein